jgi:hypothetical protein
MENAGAAAGVASFIAALFAKGLISKVLGAGAFMS